MKEYTYELDVHLTKVVQVPDNFGDQVSYERLKAGKEGDRFSKKSLYSIFSAIGPLISNYDDVKVKKAQMFITKEGDNNGEPGDQSESKADVPADGDVAGQSVENA